MAKKAVNGQHTLSWARFRGRNGVDDPSTLPADMGTEAINWIITPNGLGERRRGTVKMPFTGTFTGAASLTRFQPTQDDGQAILVFSTFDSPSKFMHISAGTAAAALPQPDQLVGSPQLVAYATGNGKLFLAYKSTAGNRLHVVNPSLGMNLRLAGLGLPDLPTAADTGSGSFPAVLRFYRVQQRVGIGGAVSGLGIPVGFVPSGTGAATRVTGPAAVGTATQWRLFASNENTLYYRVSDWLDLATQPFVDDTVLAATLPSLDAAPLEGARYPLPSAKYLLWDGTRLLLFGTQGDQAGNALPAVPGRVYITQALDATVEGGEDESIVMTTDIKGYVDVNRNGGAEDRALAGPIDGNVLAMQSRGIYLLKPTGAATRPYARITLSKELGCVSQWATFVGEDEAGRPAIYWLDPHRGPYRYGYDGLQWLGYDVQDLWKTFEAPLTTPIVAHGVYDPRVRRCYWWITTGAGGVPAPTFGLCFHVKEGRATQTEGVRYGWTTFTGAAASPAASVVFAEVFGNPMGRRLKPYLGYSNRIVQFDATGINVDDDGQLNESAYVALVRSKAWVTSLAPTIVQLERAWIRSPCSNAIVAQTLIRNFGDDEALLSTVSLIPQGAETRRVFLFEDAMLAGAWTFQTQLGDAAAADHYYAIDRWDARMTATDLEVGSSEL